MINAIFNLVIDLVFFIVNLFVKLIMAIFPKWSISGQFATIIDAFFGIITNATGFTYLVVGPLTGYFITIIIGLFTLRHIVLPVVNFTRKVMIK